MANLGPARFCPVCDRNLIDNLRQDYCGRCGSTVGAYAGTHGRCARCHRTSTPLAGIARAGSHEGVLRDLLLAFKYANRDELDRFFGDALSAAIEEKPWFHQVEAVVPVPTCWHRHLSGRPYIATTMARCFARATSRPYLPLLRRVRGGPSQIGLSRTQREENVRGAFRPARGVELNKSVVCLVDDVSTTGATLFECARVLKRAGAAKVYAAVVCKQHSG